jgi:hypothetical protein
MVRLEGLSKLKKIDDRIETQTSDLRVCSMTPQQSILPRAPPSQGQPLGGDQTWYALKPSVFLSY